MYIYRTTVLGLAGVDDRRRDAPSREPQPGPCPAWAHRSHHNGRRSTVARDAASDGDEDTATRPWQQRRHLQLSCCAGATARAGQHAASQQRRHCISSRRCRTRVGRQTLSSGRVTPTARAPLTRSTLTPKRLGTGRSLQCGYAHHALSNWLGPAQTYFNVFLQDVSVCKLFPSLAHPRIAILGLAGRSKRSMDGLSSFVEHGLHMVPWT